jgi:hypothetical protein
MTDHIPDAGKMVSDDMVQAALDAYSENEWRTSASAMRAALAAVALLIAKAERERCAAIAENHEWFVGGVGTKAPGSGEAKAIATAIRALGDAI